MDWGTVLQDGALIAGVSTAIFVVIDFLKRIYYKLPWGWIQKTPGEVWFALSIILGLLVALVVLWPTLTSGEGGIVDKATTAIYGVVFGGGSKLINSVFSSAGAKLKASKVANTAKAETPVQAEVPVFPDVETSVVQETPTTVTETIFANKPAVAFAKEINNTSIDYVIIDGTLYDTRKEEN
jgi:hypothetical protein